MAPTSRVGNAGFVLIEQVAVLALVGLLILLAFPNIRPGTGQSQFRALWSETAALIRDARTAAAASGHATEVAFDRRRRTIRSDKRIVSVPADVDVSVLAGASCPAEQDRVRILFRLDGTSCGASIRFSLGRRVTRLRTNWLTGHIETVQGDD